MTTVELLLLAKKTSLGFSARFTIKVTDSAEKNKDDSSSKTDHMLLPMAKRLKHVVIKIDYVRRLLLNYLLSEIRKQLLLTSLDCEFKHQSANA